MNKIIIIYYSKSGNTKRMAELIEEGAKTQDVEVLIRNVNVISSDELLEYDGIIIGSPTYYGSMAYEVKKLLDESVKFHTKLEGIVGGAFSSAANIGGGNETTILDIINAMLIHGMVIQGTSRGDHYGPVSINKPDSRVEKQCRDYGEKVAKLVLALHKK